MNELALPAVKKGLPIDFPKLTAVGMKFRASVESSVGEIRDVPRCQLQAYE